MFSNGRPMKTFAHHHSSAGVAWVLEEEPMPLTEMLLRPPPTPMSASSTGLAERRITPMASPWRETGVKRFDTTGHTASPMGRWGSFTFEGMEYLYGKRIANPVHFDRVIQYEKSRSSRN